MKKISNHIVAVVTLVTIAILLLIVQIVFVTYDFGDGSKGMTCTMEAKLCPDGSAVGRIGPRCEFAACPVVKVEQKLSDETIKIIKDFAQSAKSMDKYLPLSIRGAYNFSEILLSAVNNTDVTQLRVIISAIYDEVGSVEIADAPEGRAFKLAMTRLCIAESLVNNDLADTVKNCGAPDNYPKAVDWKSLGDDLTAEAQVLPYLISGQVMYFVDKTKAEYYLNQISLHNETLMSVPGKNWKASQLYQRILNEGDMVTWQTYRNEQYGFEVKYPVEFSIKESSLPNCLAYSLSIFDPKNKVEGHYFRLDLWKQDGCSNDYRGEPLGNYLSNFYGRNTELYTARDVIQRKISDVNGYEVYGYGAEGHVYEDDFYFTKNNLLWQLYLNPLFENRISAELYLETRGIQSEYEEVPVNIGKYIEITSPSIYKQILSTFKFTEVTAGKIPGIVDYFACSDNCPGPVEKYMIKIYEGVTDKNLCEALGGSIYTYYGWGEYTVCKVN